MGKNSKDGGRIMARSKISRKRLKTLKEPDEFMTFTGQLVQFGITYQKQLIGGFTAFFIVLIIFSAVKYFSVQNEAEASLLLSKAQEKYQKTLSSEGPEDALTEVEKDFNKILDDFSGKMAGRQARLIFANMNYDAKKVDQSIALYEASLEDWDNKPSIKNLVLNALGYAYEEKNDFEKAVTYYEKVRQGDEYIGKADALYNLGRLYAKLDAPEKSKKAYQKLNQDFTDFVYAQIVKEKTINP